MKKTVLITGCSSGIGYATAIGLKDEGYEVLVTARKPKDIERLEKEFTCYPLDYADSNSVQALIKNIETQHADNFYAVFHNGAYGQPGAVEDLPRIAIEKQFATNVFGWMELNNGLIPLFRKREEGRIIFNSSVLGLVALKMRGAYNASKYAIEGFADTLRLELKGSNIHIVLVEPGPVESKFRDNCIPHFLEHISIEDSVHKKAYQKTSDRLEQEGPAVPFTLPATAVYKKVSHALKANSPKAHYYVTFPTYLFGYLKRILPTKLLDKLLRNV